jgi:hypothetical protein
LITARKARHSLLHCGVRLRRYKHRGVRLVTLHGHRDEKATRHRQWSSGNHEGRHGMVCEHGSLSGPRKDRNYIVDGEARIENI